MKWIAIWVEGVNVFNERKTMDPAIRKRISESVKRYWTPARKAKASRLARRRAAERKEKARREQMVCEAEKRASEAGWPFTRIQRFWEKKYREWWAAHNDSDDWELVRGKGLVRTKHYGKPVPPGTPVPKTTDDDLKLLSLINLYRDWEWPVW